MTMRPISVIAILLMSFSAFADALRADKHVVKIEGATRQYNVQIFDAESRKPVAHLKVAADAEAETSAGTVHYKVRVQPFGEAYLVDFTATDGTEVIDTMRAAFTPGSRTKPVPARAPQRGGRDVNEAKVLRRVEPVYTDDAKAAGAAGSVVVEVAIDRSGFVRDAKVIKPMGYGLDESAVDAVLQWQFAPTIHEKLAVEVVQDVTIEFKP
jgi:TonB family protein